MMLLTMLAQELNPDGSAWSQYGDTGHVRQLHPQTKANVASMFEK